MRVVVAATAFVALVGCSKSEAKRDAPVDPAPASASASARLPIASARAEPEPVRAAVEMPWLSALKEPEYGPTIPFACENISVKRGWHFHGEAPTTATAIAELVAFHVRSTVTAGYAARLVGEDGDEISTEFVFVRADPRGAPIDRFFGTTTASVPTDIVAIAPVLKGTKKLTFRARNTSPSSHQYCDTPVALGEAPPWPPMPRYEVARFARTKSSLMILYQARNVLPLESSAPTLTWKPPQPAKQHGGLVQEVRAPLPRAIVSTNADGEPIPFDPKVPVHWVVAEYHWTQDETPNLYTSGEQMADLPAATTWTVSSKLRRALDESNAVRDALYDTALNAYFSGGREGLQKALAANLIRPR